MIGSYRKGLVLFQDGAQAYSDVLPGDGDLTDIVYHLDLKCYFLGLNGELYKKDIYKEAPYIFMDVACSSVFGLRLRYSNLNHRLIVLKGFMEILVINPQKKNLEAKFEKSDEDLIIDFRFFGEKHSRVVSVSEESVILYNLFEGHGRGEVYSLEETELMEERKEAYSSIAVSDKHELLLLGILGKKESHRRVSSRMLILKLTGDILTKIFCLDQFNQGMPYDYTFELCGYAGSHILWLGLSKSKSGLARIYDYNTETAELKELEDKRVGYQESFPNKLHPLNGKFYYTGHSGKLMSLSLIN